MKAIKAAGLRVPEDASPEARRLADRALERIVEVMDEQVSPFMANPVLTAARLVREEVCGAVPKKLEATGKDGGPIAVYFAPIPEGDE